MIINYLKDKLRGGKMKNYKIKFIAYIGMFALLANLVLGLMGFSNSTKEINNVKSQLLTKQVENNINLTMKYVSNHYGSLSQGKGTLLDSQGNSIEGRNGVVDAVLEDLGDKATIFVRVNDDFKRISTNIMDDDNERAVGSYLGIDHNAYQTVINGDIYIGEANLFDENYYTAYRPIKDKNNNVIGLLFVGTPTKILDNLVNVHDTQMSKLNILMIVSRAISLGSLIVIASISILARENNTSKAPSPVRRRKAKHINDIFEQPSL